MSARPRHLNQASRKRNPVRPGLPSPRRSALISVGMTPACLNGEANVFEINSNDDWYGLSAGYSNVAGTRSLVLRSAR
ncbi:hypothetical protein ACVW1A_000858 [Bradyrhizobium sp. LB1.3]